MATRPTKSQTSQRTGRYVQQASGFSAFYPAEFPPRDLELTPLLGQLSEADQALGRLAGSASILPDPDLFVLMYVRREAVLSSQIEGTQASLMDVLEWEASPKENERRLDVNQVSNYVAALNYGLERVASLPLSLRLLREIHQRLTQGVRGGEAAKTPGEFRRSQNWVGGPSPATALYVPPPVPEMHQALDQFERFIHSTNGYPLLVRIALAQAQFETIHPFLDGNGRIGRLLISFMLCHHGVLDMPLLYLSIFFKEHRQTYYDRLQAVRDDGAWESWVAFFLEGTATVAHQATETVRKIVHLHEHLRERLSKGLGRRSGIGLRLLEHLFHLPVVSVKQVEALLGVAQPTASSLVNTLEELGVLQETTGKQRNRVFVLEEYLKLFAERDRRR